MHADANTLYEFSFLWMHEYVDAYYDFFFNIYIICA